MLQMLSAAELSRCFIAAVKDQQSGTKQDPMPPHPPNWAIELAAECARQAVIAFCDKNGLEYPGPR